MNKFSKILITCIVAVFVVAGGIFVAETNVLENNRSSKITINETDKTRVYSSAEDIILGGTAAKESEIILSWNGGLGLTESNENGEWSVNLGKMSEGKYSLQVVSNDLPNIQSIATAQITVDNSSAGQTVQVSFTKNIFNFLTAALSLKTEVIPDKLIIISQDAPSVLQGNWNLLD